MYYYFSCLSSADVISSRKHFLIVQTSLCKNLPSLSSLPCITILSKNMAQEACISVPACSDQDATITCCFITTF